MRYIVTPTDVLYVTDSGSFELTGSMGAPDVALVNGWRRRLLAKQDELWRRLHSGKQGKRISRRGR